MRFDKSFTRFFSKILSNKISLVLLLAFHFLEGVNVPFRPNNHKSCIRCQKLCKACFRRHMECAVLKRFLKVQGTFSIKKFLQIPLSIWKKLNLILFIKALIKLFTPHLLRFAQHFFPEEKALNPSVKPSVCHLPFQGRL